MKTTLLGLFCCISSLLFVPAAAQAQNCTPLYLSGFAQLPLKAERGATDTAARGVVAELFGARPDLCEEGAYTSFAEGLTAFARGAMRTKPKDGRDNLLRLAIAVVRQAPARVPFKESKAATTRYKQIKSDLNATAEDVGFTPLMSQLISTVTELGAPNSGPAPSEIAPVSGTGPTTGPVQAIRVPLQPLPTWAVIKLYEMRDHAKAQDVAAIQIKLQDIINWMEETTKNQ